MNRHRLDEPCPEFPGKDVEATDAGNCNWCRTPLEGRFPFKLRKDGPAESRQEATDCPIYLLQQKRLIFKEEANLTCSDHDKSIYEHWNEHSENYEASEAEPEATDQCEEECAVYEEWDTLYVYASREEAEAYAKLRPYAWGKLNEGVRVYSVSARGELIIPLGGRN